MIPGSRQGGCRIGVSVALLVAGCSYTTRRWNEDHVLSSVRNKQPASETRYLAQVEVTDPTRINVRAFKQSICDINEEQTIARTVATERTPQSWSGPAAALGVLVTAMGFLVDYKVAQGTPTSSGDKFTTSDAIYIHTVGAVLIGQYILARVMSGRSETPAGEVKKVENHPREICSEEPAADVLVRIENPGTGAHIQARTDARGQAALPVSEDEPAFRAGWTCDLGGCSAPPFQVYVAGANTGQTTLANLRAVEKARGAVQASYQQEQARRMAAQEQAYQRFRDQLAVGDQTHCGMVIELKKPIVKVQTAVGEKWFRVEKLLPPGRAGCPFINDQYVGP
jgi:hypothetical protein